MKILQITLTTDYKLLPAGTGIDFLPKSKVQKTSSSRSLIPLSDSIYYPIEWILVGRNSSGKTTILNFLNLALRFLRNGRLPQEEFPLNSRFGFKALLFSKGEIYEYQCELIAIAGRDGMVINYESLAHSPANPSLRRNLSNLYLRPSLLLAPALGGTYSSIAALFSGELDFAMGDMRDDYAREFAETFSLLNTYADQPTINALAQLFDETIEELALIPGNAVGHATQFRIKRQEQEPVIGTLDYVCSVLSSGTIRGIILFGRCICAFRMGGYILVDEIENSFHKNLIDNLRVMFADTSINVAGATLIYSTHYAQLLDLGERWDNISIVQREGSRIRLENMAADYRLRSDTIRSQWFDQNAFGTLSNYERLVELKGLLKQ